MKSFFKFLLVWIVLSGCGQAGDHAHNHQASEAVSSNENEALYDEVMKIHDEGMEKMGEIHRLKKVLKERLAAQNTERKTALEGVIAKLDSADKGMMDWMHNFDPVHDTDDKEAYREFLESELAKVTKVRQDIMEALERANEEIAR